MSFIYGGVLVTTIAHPLNKHTIYRAIFASSTVGLCPDSLLVRYYIIISQVSCPRTEYNVLL
jgi:hypothetical protein